MGRAPRPLEGLLERFEPLTPPSSAAGAAVTMVLREGSSEVEVLLIERTVDPDDPASGQVALPGGHVGAGDTSLVVTALRELEEEVGLTETDLAGPLRYVWTPFAARFGIHVAVFAARLSPNAGLPSVRSSEEVAHVFWLKEGKPDPQAVHVGFVAKDRAQVDAFYQAALEAGGRSLKPPQVRLEYYPGYYATWVLDPDGHDIEVVHKG